MTTIAAFIRKTSAPSLRAYFDQVGIELPPAVNWNGPEAEIAGPLLRAVDEMSDGERARILLDIGRVSAMATEAGQIALYSVATDRRFLDSMSGPHERTMWVFRYDEVRFRQAEEVRYTDERRRGRSWDGFMVEPGRGIRRDSSAMDAFSAAIRERFDSANVHVDIFERQRLTFDGETAELMQVTVYREGMPEDALEFEATTLVRKVTKPVFEAAVTYEPSTGVIEVVGANRESREDMALFVARDLLGIEFEGQKLPVRRYDLSVLLQPFDFPRDLQDGIESVTLKQLRLMPLDHPGERVTLECMRDAGHTIWEMANLRFGENNPLLGGWVATQARLVIKFRPRDGATRGRTLSLVVTMPHGCNLKDLTPDEQLIGGKYLRRWGILSGADGATGH
jgi:hypothetical protein